jgi:hypothetical protein
MKEVLKALLSAKKDIGKVAKNAKNPHFKNTYADINALIEAVEPILLDNGLVLLQPVNDLVVTTRIIHAESGEEISSAIALPNASTPQQLGSAITYYRRYTLQSLLSLQAEDDDGNEANKAPAKLPAVDFNGAVEAIKAGKATLAQILKTRSVTDAEKKALEEVELETNKNK